MTDKLLKIINCYGVIPQLEYYHSELWELYEAIKDYEEDYIRVDCDDNMVLSSLKEHIAEELGDNFVMLYQIPLYYYEKLDVHNIAPYEFKTDNYEHIEDIDEYFKKLQKSIFKLDCAIIVAEEREQDYISEFQYENIIEAVDEVIYKLMSIKEYYRIPNKKVQKVGNFKINRQLERIKNKQK